MAEPGSTLKMFYFYGFVGGTDDSRDRYPNLWKDQTAAASMTLASGFYFSL